MFMIADGRPLHKTGERTSLKRCELNDGNVAGKVGLTALMNLKHGVRKFPLEPSAGNVLRLVLSWLAQMPFTNQSLHLRTRAIPQWYLYFSTNAFACRPFPAGNVGGQIRLQGSLPSEREHKIVNTRTDRSGESD